jgi:hypothetical protein
MADARAGLDRLLDIPAWSVDEEAAALALVEASVLRAKAEAVELRFAALADGFGVGIREGAASTADWWAHTRKLSRVEARRRMALARRLDGDREAVGDALAAGDLDTEQARVVADAVDALPVGEVGPGVVRDAELRLIALGREHDARALRVLGRRILDVVAPHLAEDLEHRQLLAEEEKAARAVSLTMSDDGHGITRGRFAVPTAQAQMWRQQLLAFAAPARHSDRAGSEPEAAPAPAARPHALVLGEALVEWIERYPADRLPDTGGVSATAVVHLELDTLLGSLTPAHLDTGAVISASQARRLACEAGIIPAVLGGKSQVLDLGRTRRFHTRAQRIALGVRDGGCTAEGCEQPPGWCHAHHDPPWSRGNGTNLDQARLLCARHHRMIHDTRYTHTSTPTGKVRIHLRT